MPAGAPGIAGLKCKQVHLPTYGDDPTAKRSRRQADHQAVDVADDEGDPDG